MMGKKERKTRTPNPPCLQLRLLVALTIISRCSSHRSGEVRSPSPENEEAGMCDRVPEPLLGKCSAAAFVMGFLKESSERQREALDKMCLPPPWEETQWRTKNLPPSNGTSFYPAAGGSTFHSDDLVPPSVHPAESYLFTLNQETLDYSGNWGVRMHDTVILECGHNGGYGPDRVYYDTFVGHELNKQTQGSNCDEVTCPLVCFSKSRKLLHNQIWEEIFGKNILLHTTCKSDSACPDDPLCVEAPTDQIKTIGGVTSRPRVTESAFKLRPLKVDECGSDGKAAPKAVFIVGVPASGKDALLKDAVKDLMGQEKYVVADPDALKDLLVEKGTDSLAMLVKALETTVKGVDQRPFVVKHYNIKQVLAQHIHRESIILGFQAQTEAMASCRHFSLQKTGTRWSDVKTYVQAAKVRGYEVHVYAAHVHPFANWANHLYRVKHFGSAGRAMNRGQVIKDNFYFPQALQQMLEDYINELRNNQSMIDGLKLIVYGNIQDVLKGKEGAKADLFSETQMGKGTQAALDLWDSFANFKTEELQDFFNNSRTQYEAELNAVAKEPAEAFKESARRKLRDLRGRAGKALRRHVDARIIRGRDAKFEGIGAEHAY